MLYNSIIETEVITDVVTEPVTLIELKQHMNMQFDTSGSYMFNDDDTYLVGLIKIARDILEQYTGLSFAQKSYRVIVSNELGGIDIPWGPNITSLVIKDSDGLTQVLDTDYKVIGNINKQITSNYACYLDMTYTAGYADGKLPYSLKRAIMEECEFRYNNRGSQGKTDENICKSAIELATPYKKTSWLV